MNPYYKNELTTIYNGDCLEVMDYLIEQGIKVDAIITDPPYGTTACSWDTIIPFDKMWERLKLLRKDNTPIVLFGSEPFSSYLRMNNIKEYKYDWIWKKKQGTNPMLCKKQPMRIFDKIIVFYKKQTLYNPQMISGKPYKGFKSDNNKIGEVYGDLVSKHKENKGNRYPINIIEYNREYGFHPTQKPKELMQYLIKTYTKENDLILDFTAGSFTTNIAAEQLNRRSIGIELEKKYCDIGIKRLKHKE